MTIIPAEQRSAAQGVFRVLEDLAWWADDPHHEELPDEWAAAYRNNVRSVLGAYERSCSGEPEAVQLAKRCMRVCLDFIGLMANVPGLSNVTRKEWTVPSHQRLFDELAELRDYFGCQSTEDRTSQSVNEKTGQHSADGPKADVTRVNAKRLSDHVGCHPKVIKTALQSCNPVIRASGRNGGHQWQYSEAVAELRKVTTGKLEGVIWPDSAAELSVPKHSSKIPAKSLRR